MDRLAAWFHWNDRNSLLQAIWVAEKHPISIQKIKNWAKNENEPQKLEEFVEMFKKSITKESK